MARMNLKKFGGPAILISVVIVLNFTFTKAAAMKFEDGDIVPQNWVNAMLCNCCISVILTLAAVIWFAYALGYKSQKTVFLAQNPADFQHGLVPVADGSTGTVVGSVIGKSSMSYVREKIVIEKGEDSSSQMAGLIMLLASFAVFAIMILFGLVSIIMSAGPGLGFSGGTCNSTCEFMWSGATLSMWASLLLFGAGLVALARPWSWFRSLDDLNYPVISTSSPVDGLEFESLTVNELKIQLREVGLPVSGKKVELVARLSEHRQESTADKSTAECVNCQATLAPSAKRCTVSD
jgi:hypothetical protein